MHLSLSPPGFKRSYVPFILLGILLILATSFALFKLGDGAMAIPLALPLGLAMVVRPFFGLLLLAASIPVESVFVVGSGDTLARVLGIAVFGIWLTYKLMRRESWKAILSSTYFWLMLTLLSFAFLSVWWAKYPEDVFRPLFSLLQSFALSLMVADMIVNWKLLDGLLKTLVLATFLAASLTLFQFIFQGILRAGSNISGGLNNTAQVLVTIVPFAFYLIKAHRRGLWRALGVLYVVFAICAVLVTLSRTSFILMGLVLVAEFWELLRKGEGRSWIFFTLGLVLAIYYLYLPQEDIVERVQTIGPEIEAILAGGSSGEEYSQRGFYYRVGWEIFLDHPILGAGYENFRRLYLVYQYRVEGAQILFTDPRSPHNTYIGFLANLGIVGFGLWMMILGNMALCLNDTWKKLADIKTSLSFFALQAVSIAFYLQVAYGLTRPIEKEKLVWVLFGLTLAITTLSQKSDQPQGT